jgi:hypothetical protein
MPSANFIEIGSDPNLGAIDTRAMAVGGQHREVILHFDEAHFNQGL